jgi:hypothetical protein
MGAGSEISVGVGRLETAVVYTGWIGTWRGCIAQSAESKNLTTWRSLMLCPLTERLPYWILRSRLVDEPRTAMLIRKNDFSDR